MTKSKRNERNRIIESAEKLEDEITSKSPSVKKYKKDNREKIDGKRIFSDEIRKRRVWRIKKVESVRMSSCNTVNYTRFNEREL